MTRLTHEEIRKYISDRYPEEKIAKITMINDEETMAFVLTYMNTSSVTRYTIDIDSDGYINTWAVDRAGFEQIWRREFP